MKKVFTFLIQSPKERIKISVISLIFILSIIVSVILAYHVFTFILKNTSQIYYTNSSIQYLKKNLQLTRSLLIRELILSKNASNKQPISHSNISQEELNFKVKRAQFRYYAKDLKISLFFMLSFFGLMTLLYASRRNQNLLMPQTPSKW